MKVGAITHQIVQDTVARTKEDKSKKPLDPETALDLFERAYKKLEDLWEQSPEFSPELQRLKTFLSRINRVTHPVKVWASYFAFLEKKCHEINAQIMAIGNGKPEGTKPLSGSLRESFSKERAGKSYSKEDADPLSIYFRDISEFRLISQEEEIALAERIKNGDEKAKEELITANLRLGVEIAKRYQGFGLSLEDLIQEASRGIVRAVEKFKTVYQTKFDTYGVIWIKQFIKRALQNQAKTIRLPNCLQADLSSFQKLVSKMKEELGRAPTEEEIAKRMYPVNPEEIRQRVSKKEKEELPFEHEKVQRVVRRKEMRALKWVKELLEAARIAVSSLDGLEENGQGRLLGKELIQDKRTEEPITTILAQEEVEKLYEALGMLSPREREIVEERNGLRDGNPKTLKELAESTGITREGVRVIEWNALKKLQDRLAEEKNDQKTLTGSLLVERHADSYVVWEAYQKAYEKLSRVEKDRWLKTFSRRVKDKRLAMGLSILGLKQAAGFLIDCKAICFIENGRIKKYPRFKAVVGLAKGLETGMESLLRNQ